MSSIRIIAPTMRELMTHTAGFSYGTGKRSSRCDVSRLEGDAVHEPAGDDREAGEDSAVYQPGNGWLYSSSMDIQGYIVEKLSGQSLPDFMREHIYEPLGMHDAGFYVPEEKRGRFATLYNVNPQGELVAGEPGDYTKQPTAASGGGGMVSTAEDYFRFASMLANGGELDGKRVLAPSTVKLMTSNHTPDSLLTGEFGIGMSMIRPGFAWAYDCAVIFDPTEANLLRWQGDFLLGWGGGNMVLCRSDQRHCFCGDDPAQGRLG